MTDYTKEKNIELPMEEVNKLLGHGDGNAALLYLHVRRAGTFSLGRAARELKCTEAELLAAAGTLRALGLLDAPEPAEITPSEAPQYTAEDVAARARTDSAFEAVVAEAETALGRVLSTNDLKLLFGIYDYWGLQADVIMLLLHHCVEKYQARSGPGRKPTMRYVEKEAQYWARTEINTLDAAEEYLRKEKEKRALTGQIKEALQIRGRELTGSELKYIEEWIGLGFGPEAVAVAYDRTVLSTGKLAWKYMDRILHSWAEQRLFTPVDIESRDPRRASAAAKPGQTEPARGDSEMLETMRRMYARMKGNKE